MIFRYLFYLFKKLFLVNDQSNMYYQIYDKLYILIILVNHGKYLLRFI